MERIELLSALVSLEGVKRTEAETRDDFLFMEIPPDLLEPKASSILMESDEIWEDELLDGVSIDNLMKGVSVLRSFTFGRSADERECSVLYDGEAYTLVKLSSDGRAEAALILLYKK